MADVFEPRSDLDPWRERLWQLITDTPCLDWLLLTKRPEKIASRVPWRSNWPSNVWIGTTVENQEWADKRIPYLVELPAGVLFLSCEPLLGPLDLTRWMDRIHWVIVGGESGPHARILDPKWVCSLRDQVVNAGRAFFFKQWGEWKTSGTGVERVGKKSAGRLLDGIAWSDFPNNQRHISKMEISR
jgi:protein gp37